MSALSERSVVRGGRRAARALAATAIVFFSACFVLWRSLPIDVASATRTVPLVVRSSLLFPGLGRLLWARLVLGDMHNVSTSSAVRLYADHRLVTRGPSAVIRHPTYVGLILVSAGALAVYCTWTMLLTTVCFFFLRFRARREEEALQAAFGRAYEEYRRRVPAWMPRIGRRNE